MKLAHLEEAVLLREQTWDGKFRYGLFDVWPPCILIARPGRGDTEASGVVVTILGVQEEAEEAKDLPPGQKLRKLGLLRDNLRVLLQEEQDLGVTQAAVVQLWEGVIALAQKRASRGAAHGAWRASAAAWQQGLETIQASEATGAPPPP